jgi:hypothetical protein
MLPGEESRTEKRKRLNGVEPGGASGSQAMTIKDEQRGGEGDANLEPIVSSPAT